MSTSRLSLAEQIARLDEASPLEFDPEEIQVQDGEGQEDSPMEGSLSRQHYVDVGPSALRNALPSVADPKYEGVRASRKELLEESADEEEQNRYGDEGEDDEDLDFEGTGKQEDQASRDDDAPSSDVESDGSEEEDDQPHVPSKRKPENEDNDVGHSAGLSLNLRQAREEDIRKGKAVKSQLALWDTLLDTRIRLQKAVVSANMLPPPSHIQNFLEASDCHKAVSSFLDESSRLLDELDELQQNLITSNKIVSQPPRKRHKVNEDIPEEEYTRMLSLATEDATSIEECLHPYVLQTLSKWSSKIQAVAPSALIPSNRGAFLKGNLQSKSAIQLIDEVLADNSKILERTRTLRTKKPRIGVEPSVADVDEPDTEIFDDTDFYQKMLRDIIDSRRDGNKNEDWMLLQKQKKVKKKVDTKASKGRKLRFEVHEKIQNFMVPVPVPGAWHDEQIDELFASLLGKGFENVALNAEGPEPQETIELTGLRVFG